MKQKYILFMLLSIIAFNGISQNNYKVTPIPFQPYTGTLPALSTNDDKYSSVITLPFSFDYYGNVYNQLLISTNGYIDFRTSLAGQDSPWSFSIPIPNINFPVKNAILACYEDLDSRTGSGTIVYGSYGTAPYRKFVVSFNNQSHYNCGSAAISSFQVIISETSNVVDVQLTKRQPCQAWSGGAGVIGLINATGSQGIAPLQRNTGSWSAVNEAWRFYRPGYYLNYSFVRCDDDTDGIQVFDLTVASRDLFPDATAVAFYKTSEDAQAQVNAIINPTAYLNTANPQTIYINNNGVVRPVALSVIDCAVDADGDTVATSAEDVNNDTNLANDDTDFDGLADYLDNDDDGDLVLTSLEYVFGRSAGQNLSTLLDTDSDGIPNYLDRDDDGDSLFSFQEDYNHDGNPMNDDTNTNGTPDYLESAVALGVSQNHFADADVKIFPNPVSSLLNIQNNTGNNKASIEIFSINGAIIRSVETNEALTAIPVADLQDGIYFVKVTMDSQVANYKFIKN